MTSLLLVHERQGCAKSGPSTDCYNIRESEGGVRNVVSLVLPSWIRDYASCSACCPQPNKLLPGLKGCRLRSRTPYGWPPAQFACMVDQKSGPSRSLDDLSQLPLLSLCPFPPLSTRAQPAEMHGALASALQPVGLDVNRMMCKDAWLLFSKTKNWHD